jgi:hypothetical protein
MVISGRQLHAPTVFPSWTAPGNHRVGVDPRAGLDVSVAIEQPFLGHVARRVVSIPTEVLVILFTI